MADWQRLGELVIARRIELKYKTRAPFAEASGISPRILGDIETGRRGNYDPKTIAALENTLGWTTGSVNQILNGQAPTLRQPTPTTLRSDAADEALIRVMKSEQLTDADKARIVRLLIAEKEAFNRRIAEQADEFIRTFESGS